MAGRCADGAYHFRGSDRAQPYQQLSVLQILKTANSFTGRWFFEVAAVAVAGVAAIVGFNYIVDTAFLFSPQSSLKKAAREVVNGKLVGGMANFDRRLFEEYLIGATNKKVDVMAVGFSRTIQLRRCQLPLPEGAVYWNNSVVSGSMPDYLAILEIYRERKGYFPKTVIIGVEPWTFNASWDEKGWRSIETYYHHMLASIGQSETKFRNPIPARYLELIDLEYTLNNIANVRAELSEKGVVGTLAFLNERARKSEHKVDFYIAPNTDVDDYVIGTDGSLYYPRSVRNPTPEYVMEKAVGYADTRNSIVNWTRIDNKDVFESFVRYLKSQGTEVVLLLNPFHPVAYKSLVDDPRYKLLPELEQYVRAFGAREKLQVLGSYDPSRYGFENMDFQDAMHGQPWVLERIFRDFRPSGANALPPSSITPAPMPTEASHC